MKKKEDLAQSEIAKLANFIGRMFNEPAEKILESWKKKNITFDTKLKDGSVRPYVFDQAVEEAVLNIWKKECGMFDLS